MRQRTEPYTPSPASYEYDCGAPIRLIPADPWEAQGILARVGDAYGEDETLAGPGYFAVMAYLLWDDDALEWEAGFDPDALACMSGVEMRAASEALRAELFSRRTIRCGVRPVGVIEAVRQAIGGQPPK